MPVLAKQRRGDVDDGPDLFTVEELAAYFRVSDKTVRTWIRQGKIRASQIGGWRITREERDRVVREGIR